jgi:hypothetical protein
MYTFGATVCPELPTCRSIGSQPASQIGRDAASSAPRALASSSTIGMFSFSLMPRPTETMISAASDPPRAPIRGTELRLLPDLPRIQRRREILDWPPIPLQAIRSPRARLKDAKYGHRRYAHIAVQLALETAGARKPASPFIAPRSRR